MMNEIPIIIIGAGGHGSELSSYLHELVGAGQRVRLVGFVDEGTPRGPFFGAEILGGLKEMEALLRANPGTPFHYITAVGDNRIRQDLVRRIESLRVEKLHPWTLRHPSAAVGREVAVGEGSCLAPGSVVTTRTAIGRHCILNVNASVSHDCMIGDFVNLNPGAVVCGKVQVGQGCFIGAGATLIDEVSLGDWSVIGAGAVVIEDLPPHVTAVGVPARIIKRHVE